uniref:N-acetylgalactosaminide beta-1,3-galactosyltransferase n=1 Tax=Panagrolaimus davidi TaxID=227884 RepID=A0A914PGA6_9BILA
MENLRFMLLPYNPNKPYYFGARFKILPYDFYMSGGAGIILSREALKQIAESLDNSTICQPASEVRYHDDLHLGECVANLGITSVDTRDNLVRL